MEFGIIQVVSVLRSGSLVEHSFCDNPRNVQIQLQSVLTETDPFQESLLKWPRIPTGID